MYRDSFVSLLSSVPLSSAVGSSASSRVVDRSRLTSTGLVLPRVGPLGYCRWAMRASTCMEVRSDRRAWRRLLLLHAYTQRRLPNSAFRQAALFSRLAPTKVYDRCKGTGTVLYRVVTHAGQLPCLQVSSKSGPPKLVSEAPYDRRNRPTTRILVEPEVCQPSHRTTLGCNILKKRTRKQASKQAWPPRHARWARAETPWR